eukprot:g15039.t1
MGESIAPPGANALATVALENWATRNPKEFKYTTILRYVDDMIAIATYDHNNVTTKEQAQQTLDGLFNDVTQTKLGVFKQPLKIVEEPYNDDGSTNFLEVQIGLTKGNKSITTRYRRKNETTINSTDTDKLKLIVPYESFGPKDRHAAKINGMFKRIQRLSPTETKDKKNTLYNAASTYIQELLQENYPFSVIRRIIRAYSSIDNRWTKLLQDIIHIR